MRLFFFFLLLIPSTVNAQLDLFNLNSSTQIVATKEDDRTQGLFLDKQNERYLLDNRPSNETLALPFFGDMLYLSMRRMQIYTNDFQIVSISDDGLKFIQERPTILTYELFYKDNSIGVLNLFDGLINATFKYNDRQYEISFFKDEYILFEASNSINSSNFSCILAEQTQEFSSGSLESISSTPVCIELAIEIDNYTRQTFSSNIQTINWALAIVAGVSQIYDANTNAAIQVTYSYVWNTTDPYSAYTSQASNMLSELRNYWNTNNTISLRK